MKTRVDPLIVALFGKLPPAGSHWPTDKQEVFLRTCESVFDLLYRKPRIAKVLARWDAEAELWVATSRDIPGLVLSGHDEEELIGKIQSVALDLLEANVGDHECNSFVIEYIRKDVVRPFKVDAENTESPEGPAAGDSQRTECRDD